MVSADYDSKYQSIRLEKVKRGEIYYFKGKRFDTGGVMSYSRPFLIVSNDTGNQHSSIACGCPLTTKVNKKWLPTHYDVYATGVKSTVLCEQLTCLDQNEINGECAGMLTDNEMEEVEKCIIISLGIKTNPKVGNKILDKYYEELENQLKEKNFSFNTDNYLTKYIKVPVIEKQYVDKIVHSYDNSRLRELEIENATLKAKLNVYEDWYNKFMSNTLK